MSTPALATAMVVRIECDAVEQTHTDPGQSAMRLINGLTTTDPPDKEGCTTVLIHPQAPGPVPESVNVFWSNGQKI